MIQIFCQETEEGAFCVPHDTCVTEGGKTVPKRHVMIMKRVGVGTTVAMRERNMHDDSDFFATYMKEDGTFEEIEYATTRFWTYTASAKVDATPEVLKAWEIAQEKGRRLTKASAHRREMRDELKVANQIGLLRPQYRRIKRALGEDMLCAVVGLLKTRHGGKFRNPFRAKLADQVDEWVTNFLEDVENRYPSPLSPRQLECASNVSAGYKRQRSNRYNTGGMYAGMFNTTEMSLGLV